MKIGIVTLTGTSNYGAALQIHALQKVIEQSGAECETLSYNNPYVINDHVPEGLFKKKGLKKKLIAILAYNAYKKRLEKFKAFENKYCRLSKKEYYPDNINEANNKYDRFVTGSDQVWNNKITHGDTNYFLDFVSNEKKKFSYAASSGTDGIDDEKNISMLEDFDLISVRETRLEDFLKTGFSDEKASLVRTDVDPTFLLDSSYWKKFVSERPREKDYIFLYLFGANPSNIDFIRKLKKKYNCDVIALSKFNTGRYGFKYVYDLSPEEFLNYIYHAKFVVTGSFHAFCFSVQFEKDVYITSSPIPERSARLINLAETLGMTDRILGKSPEEKAPLNYEPIKEKVKKYRDISMETISLICSESVRGGI